MALLFPFVSFVVAGIAVYVAGISLSDVTNVLAVRWKLGEDLSGLILLAVVTILPEFVIAISAVLSDNLPLAIGNILGGIAIQTVVLAYLDVAGSGKSEILTFRAASLTLVLERTLVIAILLVVIMGS
ncbi:hypothetical protein [Natrialba taiwanensis]|uniref:hypothetical protein n=1 Tax=Natrialba taiwanensis TaxID=160846 RepID=UPI000AE7042F|nr:hypothetical protein [Natrialba taiwanensis]